MMAQKLIDETGNRYGKLVVLERAGLHPTGRQATWRCLCDCGNEKIVTGGNLRHKNHFTKSCGCLKERAPGEVAFNSIHYDLRYDAKKRGHSWHLSESDVRYLTSLPCAYCGLEPFNVYVKAGDEYVYTGIDRMDNNKGYSLGNVVPCCKFCNGAKGPRSLEEFSAWISQVYKGGSE